AEVFADWETLRLPASRQSSYIRDDRSSTAVFDEFGDLQLFDSTVDSYKSVAGGYTDSLTSSHANPLQTKSDFSLSPVEFAGASRIDEGAGSGAVPDVMVTGSDEHGHNVQKLFDDNFDRLDKDHDGFISENEIDRAMTNPKFTGEDAALVAML